MKLWLRVDCDTPRDPRVGRLADLLGIPVDHGLGLLLRAWAAMAEHAPDGNLADFTDGTVNSWVGWPTQPARRSAACTFAQAYRSVFLDTAGVDEGFAFAQGKLMERAEKNRARVKLWREKQKLATRTETPGVEARSAFRTRTETPPYTPTERHVNGSSSSSSTPPARALSSELQGLFEEDFPRSQITQFLSALASDADAAAWDGRLLNWLNGRDWPDELRPSPQELASALGEYLGAGETTFSPPHVRAFVVRTMTGWRSHSRKLEPHRAPRSKTGGKGKGNGKPAAGGTGEGRSLTASERMVW